jgi:hypothetical protein
MKYAEEWRNVWNASIQAFTGRNKVTGREIEAVTSPGPRRLADSLKALDETDPEWARNEEKAAAHKKFHEEQRTFIDEANDYKTVLNDAIRATPKNTYPNAYRELKVLLRQLDLMVAKVHNKVVQYSEAYKKAQEKATAKLNKATQKLRSENADDTRLKAETNFLKQKKLLVGWGFLTKQGLAKAAVAVQKIKAAPATPPTAAAETYNFEMDHAGREISQQFGNVLKLIRDTKCPQGLVREMAGLDALETDLKAFGNGAKRKVPLTAQKVAVLAQLKDFSKLVKNLTPYYNKMTTYLATHKV